MSQSPYERVSDSNFWRLAGFPARPRSQSPYERVSDSNTRRPARSAPPGVSIPLRTGLGFELPGPANMASGPGSQSPYERVSDSNSRDRGLSDPRVRLNPLTNGSRIRTSPDRSEPRQRQVVSIPLRTGLGFELLETSHVRHHHPGLNPLTNGSRIRTALPKNHR